MSSETFPKLCRFLILKIYHPQHYYEPVMKALNLNFLENKRLLADENILLKLLQGKIDAPRLLERISLQAVMAHTKFR